MTRMWVPVAIFVIGLTDLVRLWLCRYDVDFEEGRYPPDGIIRWGTCRGYARKDDTRYIQIRVPFVSQYRVDYCRRELWCWHIPVLFRAHGEWRVYWEPVIERRTA